MLEVISLGLAIASATSLGAAFAMLAAPINGRYAPARGDWERRLRLNLILSSVSGATALIFLALEGFAG